jgi:hypothetical protein
MPKIYALYGKMGSGKDYLARLLVTHINEPIKCISFADALKEEVENLIQRKRMGKDLLELSAEFDLPKHVIDSIFNEILPLRLTGISAYKKTPEIRKLFQFYGDVRRAEDPLYFIRKTFDKVTSLLRQSYTVIITDVRFPNEYEACHEHNAILVHMNIDRKTRHARLEARDGFIPSIEAEKHVSETALDDIPKYDTDIVITADLSDDEMVARILAG